MLTLLGGFTSTPALVGSAGLVMLTANLLVLGGVGKTTRKDPDQ